MEFKNTTFHYGLVAILFHWIMAIIIIGMLGLGLYMVQLPISPQKLKLYGLHKEFGVLVLGLTVLRLLWRIVSVHPSLPTYMPNWQKIAAYSAHFAFYIFMLAMPITGWIMSSAAGFPVSFFGLFTLPDLVSADEKLRLLFASIHEFLAYIFIITILIHVAATLQHYVVYKHNLLRRMWP